MDQKDWIDLASADIHCLPRKTLLKSNGGLVAEAIMPKRCKQYESRKSRRESNFRSASEMRYSTIYLEKRRNFSMNRQYSPTPTSPTLTFTSRGKQIG